MEYIQSVKYMVTTYHEVINTIQEPLSEHQILEIQEKFLTNGAHLIKVPSIEYGRALVSTFIETIGVHHEIAHIALHQSNAIHPPSANVYDLLLSEGFLDPLSGRDLNDFFADYFFFDFMWIEATKDLLVQPWFKKFESHLMNYHIDKYIPILIIIAEESAPL